MQSDFLNTELGVSCLPVGSASLSRARREIQSSALGLSSFLILGKSAAKLWFLPLGKWEYCTVFGLNEITCGKSVTQRLAYGGDREAVTGLVIRLLAWFVLSPRDQLCPLRNQSPVGHLSAGHSLRESLRTPPRNKPVFSCPA